MYIHSFKCWETLTIKPALSATESLSTPVMKIPRLYSRPPLIIKPKDCPGSIHRSTCNHNKTKKTTFNQKLKTKLIQELEATLPHQTPDYFKGTCDILGLPCEWSDPCWQSANRMEDTWGRGVQAVGQGAAFGIRGAAKLAAPVYPSKSRSAWAPTRPQDCEQSYSAADTISASEIKSTMLNPHLKHDNNKKNMHCVSVYLRRERKHNSISTII